MPILRVTQSATADGAHLAEISLEGDSLPRQTAEATFTFEMTPQEHEDLRWYLEDFLQHAYDPAPKIAAKIEEWITRKGMELFRAIFHSSDDTRDLWATLRQHVNETRIEIITSVKDATTLPWELLRDSTTDLPLVLRARSFVRAQPQAAQRPRPQIAAGHETGPIRILLVICRPRADEDVPFRSVASKLIRNLSDEARELFQLDVLRPPTFEQLASTLAAAKTANRPYHVVHFDGHGAYLDVEKMMEQLQEKTSEAMLKLLAQILDIDVARYSPATLYPHTPTPGQHGYLLFENDDSQHNTRFVDGQELGKLLVSNGVTTLVLNACRSAHAEHEQPEDAAKTDEGTASAGALPKAATPDSAENPHAQVRALGSFAQEVMDAGMTGVVAMRYNVYVVTAAQFVADLYASLAQGQSLGEAATFGRKQLAAQPLREIGYESRPLQDWSVPVVYEAAPVELFPRRIADAPVKVTLQLDTSTTTPGMLDADLPKAPDVGFVGRDETILALDRAFDDHSIVILHAYAGSGKTSAAAEFARWYAETGGVDGPVLYTSFEQRRPLPRVLDQIARVPFVEKILHQNEVEWLTLSDSQRRGVALQILEQVPALWIWDNVEPIAGFPTGRPSAWTEEEQKELADFLRDARETKSKFLLTSRRDERAWLGDLPHRVQVSPMPMHDRVQLARAVAGKQSKQERQLADIKVWLPLLRFTGGNPLTITVLVGQALHDGLRAKEQIDGFVRKLRAGEAQFDDEASEGRSRSLGASLSYGFEHAFTEEERKRLALLHFFQGFVNVHVLRLMGDADAVWCLDAVRGLDGAYWIGLLDRAAEIGLLAPYGGGLYSIHPALPWFFKSLYDSAYRTNPETDGEAASRIAPVAEARAFTEAIGIVANVCHHEYGKGRREMIRMMKAEEPNFLFARQIARSHGWWNRVVSAMQGLKALYLQTGRSAEWSRLVSEIEPDFIDPTRDWPLPGREDDWSLVAQYRIDLAAEARNWPEAERQQALLLTWDRQRAVLPVQRRPGDLAEGKNRVLSVVASLHQLGEIEREQGKAKCADAYQEAYELALRVDATAAAATCAFNLGTTHKDIEGLRDLDIAERWFLRSLELHDDRDQLGRGRCEGQLGGVSLSRFRDAVAAHCSDNELLQQHLAEALRRYRTAITLIPKDAGPDLAIAHNQLGIIFGIAGDLDSAMRHYRDSIRHDTHAGNLFGAAQTLANVARMLARNGRFADALDYALAALRNYEEFGDRARPEAKEVLELIALIEEHKNEAT